MARYRSIAQQEKQFWSVFEQMKIISSGYGLHPKSPFASCKLEAQNRLFLCSSSLWKKCLQKSSFLKRPILFDQSVQAHGNEVLLSACRRQNNGDGCRSAGRSYIRPR